MRWRYRNDSRDADSSRLEVESRCPTVSRRQAPFLRTQIFLLWIRVELSLMSFMSVVKLVNYVEDEEEEERRENYSITVTKYKQLISRKYDIYQSIKPDTRNYNSIP